MKNHPSLKFLPALVLMLIVSVFAGEPTLMNATETRNVLTYYGFRNGVFNEKDDKAVDISFSASPNFGKIEKTPMIDTAEEFITAAYFTPVELTAAAKGRIEENLPKSREGVLKLCNMWKLRMAEAPYGRDKFAAAIRLVRKLASEKMGINVSHDDVEAHYARSVDNKLQGLYATIRELNSTEQQRTVDLTRAYLLNPTENNKKTLQGHVAGYTLAPRKRDAIQNFLDAVSENLRMVI